MSQKDLEPVARESGDITRERLEALRDLFPEAFGEDGLDFERLRATLGDFVDDSPERYRFTWSGKRDAIRAFQTPSRATLVPDRDNSVGWDDTGHVFIEGENLEVLKLLYRSYFGRVKCIYIDPPYNTGNDFVYPDDYADPLEQYLRVTGQKDADGNLLTSNPETSGRYHSAWLSMMYPRLFVARQLLTEDGVIFVSIDDNEVHNLRMLMNEVFGEENFVGQLAWRSRRSEDTRAKTGVSVDHEYVACYRRSDAGSLRGAEKDLSKFSNPDGDARGPWRSADLTGLATEDRRPNLHYRLVDPATGIDYGCPPKGWRFDRNTMRRKISEGRILFPASGEGRPRHKLFLQEMSSVFKNMSSLLLDVSTADGTRETNGLLGNGVFDFPKPSGLLRLLIGQAAEGHDVVLDFFAGSCTTAQAVLELNREDGGDRRFVMVQLPEPLEQPRTLDDGTVLRTIADIGRERIRRVIARMQERDSGTLDISDRETPEDLGFRAFRLVPSNYRPESEAGDTGDAAVLFTQPLADGWTPDALLHEIALKEGFDLGVQIEPVAGVSTNTVYRLTDPYKEQTCLVCLDETLHADTAKALSLTREDLFICLDSALDDTLAANLALQCRLKVI